MLLEPDTKYKVISVEENKEGFPGIIWITAEVTDSSPVIEGLVKSVEATKKGK